MNLTHTRLVDCATLLQFEFEIRQTQTQEALEFFIVNRTMDILPTAAIFLLRANNKGLFRVTRISGVSSFESHAALVVWTEQVVTYLAKPTPTEAVLAISAKELPAEYAAQWPDSATPWALWVPCSHLGGSVSHVLWFMRQNAWGAGEQALAKRLAGTFAHAEKIFTPQRRPLWQGGNLWVKMTWITTIVALLFLPVSQSVLAPATVVAKNPVVVTAPMDGVIETIQIIPNAPVKQDQILFRFEQTPLRHQHEVAIKAWEVSQAELMKTRQLAFADLAKKAELPLLEARAMQHASETQYTAELLERSVVRAQRDGIAIFQNAEQWRGRPVQVGERIMVLADPLQVELAIQVAINDAIILIPGTEIRLYLNTRPMNPIPAILEHAGYEAQTTAEGFMAYEVRARFTEGTTPTTQPPRVGLHGMAKIIGPQVSLFYYLFRRPLTTLQHTLGFSSLTFMQTGR